MRTALLLAIAAALVLAPLASAGPQPAFYYLTDAPAGPLADGTWSLEAPAADDPGGSRPVVGGSADLPSVVFAAGDDAHPDRLYGRSLIGAWLGPSVVVDANFTATLYDVDPDGNRVAIANASQPMAMDPEEVPDPTLLIPPDPTDPEGAVYYIAGQAAPLVYQPPVLLDFGIIDHTLAANHSLAIGFYLGVGGQPLPLGSASILYDAQLTPSFIYVPWYAPDAPAPTVTVTTSPTATSDGPSATSSPTGTGSDPDPILGGDDGAGSDSDKQEKQSPGLGLPLLALGLVGLTVLVRRRV